MLNQEYIQKEVLKETVISLFKDTQEYYNLLKEKKSYKLNIYGLIVSILPLLYILIDIVIAGLNNKTFSDSRAIHYTLIFLIDIIILLFTSCNIIAHEPLNNKTLSHKAHLWLEINNRELYNELYNINHNCDGCPFTNECLDKKEK